MHQETSARIPRAFLGVVVVGGMALVVGLAVAAVLGVADVLPGDVLRSLTPLAPVARNTQGLELIHIDGPTTGVARGIQLGLLGLLFGGIPAAILSTALARWRRHRERNWSGDWGNVFLVGSCSN